jgi:uncharacterized oxidoreductase
MHLATTQVLITGGASGIGLGLARRFHAAGAQVLVCGRREDRLEQVATELPGVRTRACDVAVPDDRRKLAAWATAALPGLNTLVNNAGIQRYPVFTGGEGDWTAVEQEVAINFEAPVHLSMLLLPHLVRQPQPAIVNVSSGLSFAPLARAPIYSATKAALHSFTLTLRRQLRGTAVAVVEVAPPAVDTDLGGPGLHTFGVPIDEFLDAVVPRLEAGDQEIGYGFAEQARQASREQIDAIFERMNG